MGFVSHPVKSMVYGEDAKGFYPFETINDRAAFHYKMPAMAILNPANACS